MVNISKKFFIYIFKLGGKDEKMATMTYSILERYIEKALSDSDQWWLKKKCNYKPGDANKIADTYRPLPGSKGGFSHR